MSLPIEVDGLEREFETDTGTITAIEGFDFDVSPGEVVSVVGPTGCGKSTLLNIVLGVLEPSRGSVRVGGREPYEAFDSFKGDIAAVFQEDRLLPWRTARENAELGLEALDVPADEREQRVNRWFRTLGLEGYGDAYPGELSGGMRQRVGLTRAWVIDPEVLLLDEAFGHLDEVTATELREDFLSLVDEGEHRKTVLFITHDIDEALEMGDRVLVSGVPGHLIDDVDVPPGLDDDPTLHHEYKERILSSLR